MSIYIDQHNTINRYYLEIEKYLPQLTYNPYIDEIKDDIYNKKITDDDIILLLYDKRE